MRLLTLLLMLAWLMPSSLDAAVFKHRKKPAKAAWGSPKHKPKRNKLRGKRPAFRGKSTV
jgi:hypothetical protein